MRSKELFSRLSCVVMLVFVGTGLSSVAAQQPAKEREPDAAQGILVLLSANKAAVPAGETVQFTRIIRNETNRPVNAYPFRYMNDNVRFYWVNTDSLATKRYGDGKSGMAPSFAIKPGHAKKETLSDNVVTGAPGTYYIFISCGRPATPDRFISNAIRLQVLPKKRE